MVLSLENHCSPSQQEVIAHNLQSILGETLLSDVLDEFLDKLPSPEVTLLSEKFRLRKKEKVCHYSIGT